MAFWVGVVQREHVMRGVELGIAQVNHGARAVARMQPGDGLVYYSPKTSYPDGDQLREFTAIGVIGEREPWQAHDGDFHPWRRAVHYDERAVPTPITPLLDTLEVTRGNRNWGFIMRRGLIEISENDFRVIAGEMRSTTLER
jgi:hypothetical protein